MDNLPTLSMITRARIHVIREGGLEAITLLIDTYGVTCRFGDVVAAEGFDPRHTDHDASASSGRNGMSRRPRCSSFWALKDCGAATTKKHAPSGSSLYIGVIRKSLCNSGLSLGSPGRNRT